MIPWLNENTSFPDVSSLSDETSPVPGLIAAGGDLSPERLLEAYRHGIFPWFSEGQPILWWSTNPRMVLLSDKFVVSHSLRKSLKQVHNSMTSQGPWKILFDTAFEAVVRACAAPRKDGAGTWISEDIIEGYCALHEQGYAHSSELWFEGKLVGGAYGVSIGQMFFGESMFARVKDASKIALAYLVVFLKEHGVALIDCQQETPHLASLGAYPIPRAEFLAHLSLHIEQPQIKIWQPPGMF